MDQRTTLQLIIEEFAKAISTLNDAFASAEQAEKLLNELGWELPTGIQDIGLIDINVSDVINRLIIIVESTDDERKDLILMAGRYANLLAAIQDLLTDINDVVAAFPQKLAGVRDYLNKTNIENEFIDRLISFLIVSYMGQRAPFLNQVLVFLGIFNLDPKSADPKIYQVAHIRYQIQFDLISKLLSCPRELFARTYGWGTDNFNALDLIFNFGNMLQLIRARGRIRKLPRRVEERLSGKPAPKAETDPSPQLIISLVKGLAWDPLDVGLSLYRLRPTSDGAKDSGIGIFPFAKGTSDFSFPLTKSLFLDINLTIDLQGGVSLHLRPDQSISVMSNVTNGGDIEEVLKGRIELKLRYTPTGNEKITLLSIPGGSRLEAEQFYISMGAGEVATQQFDFFVEAGIINASFFLTAAEADGFLSQILPQNGANANFDLILGYSNSNGVYIHGSSTLEIELPVHFSLGPIEIKKLFMAVPIGNDSRIPIEISSAISTRLGPLTATIDRLGFKAEFDFSANKGNLGPLDVSLKFKPPTGIGLTIDGGSFTGGGFLSFDHDNERYSGILQLEFNNQIALSAIGLLTTKLPGGKKGYSLLIIISAKFNPILLPLGFTLNGVGGLLGLNRNLNIDALREKVKNGVVDDILFPTDPVANANRIISDLQQILPPQDGRFIFAPMAIIGWGIPELFHVELGLAMEIPNPVRLALLGVLQILMPPGSDEKTSLLKLKVNFVGYYNIEKKQISFDASLIDSRIMQYTLTGDMAVRLYWGDNANLLLTVGGFHPAYEPPPMDLPSLRRVTIQLTAGNNPRILLESYFAVTSNCVMFGAKADLYAASSGFNISGFAAFDSLFYFSPFRFVAELNAPFVLRKGSSPIMTVHATATLTGPTPWNAKCSVKAKILFLKIRINFNKQWGDKLDTKIDSIDVLKELTDALNNNNNWLPDIPSEIKMHGAADASHSKDGEIVVHPFGLVVSQKKVPLNITIDKFGNAPFANHNRFEITKVSCGTDNETTELRFDEVREQFAPAQFKNMSESERIASKSFEDLPSGIRLDSNDLVQLGKCVRRDVEYIPIIVDRKGRRDKKTKEKEKQDIFSSLLKANSAAQLSFSHSRTASSPFAPTPVFVEQESYAVVNTSNLRIADKDSAGLSQAEAQNLMLDKIANDPKLENKIQVVPLYEVNED